MLACGPADEGDRALGVEMRRFLFALLCTLAAALTPAAAQTYIQPAITPLPSGPLQILPPTISPDLRIVWEVKNRFRLFRREADFRRHLAALSLKTILAAEQQMANETDGRGWAAAMLSNLCIDVMGALMATCERDGARESYLAPGDHRVEMRLIGAAPTATCSWVFDEGDGHVRDYKGPCGEEVRIRLAYGKASTITVDVAMADGPPLRASTEIEVRDLLIAGLGDSVAAGEGNPDRPIALSDEGFCFRRIGSGSEYYRPGRANFGGGRTCEIQTQPGGRVRPMGAARRALDEPGLPPLALRLPVAHRARDRGREPARRGDVPAARLHRRLDRERRARRAARARAQLHDGPALSRDGAGADHAAAAVSGRARGAARPDRTLDLVLLTVGANDIDFSGLVANVIIDATGRARADRAQRDPVGGVGRQRARAQPAARFRQAARGAQADGRRRPVARRVRLLRPSGAARRRQPLRRRADRLRRASLVPARRRAAAADLGFRERALPPRAQGDRAVRARVGLRQSGDGSLHLRRRASGRRSPGAACARAPSRIRNSTARASCRTARPSPPVRSRVRPSR